MKTTEFRRRVKLSGTVTSHCLYTAGNRTLAVVQSCKRVTVIFISG